MSARPDLRAHFYALEAVLDALPIGTNAEIARGVYMMSPRPRGRHANTQAALSGFLNGAVGSGSADEQPDWMFMVEPEIRCAPAFSRLIPDVAAWRRSRGGWPDPGLSLFELPPEWVAEVLSPDNESYDRVDKREAYGLMGVGWLWLVDADSRTVETFENERGRMLERRTFAAGEPIAAEPFPGVTLEPRRLFLP